MSDARVAFGREAEKIAECYLRRQSYQILQRNARFRLGEMDIVARQGDTLVFCEVKARHGTATGTPGEAIDRRKQRRLVRLAELFLASHVEYADLACRFDAALILKTGHQWHIELIQDAFRPGW